MSGGFTSIKTNHPLIYTTWGPRVNYLKTRIIFKTLGDDHNKTPPIANPK
jgi:hypothetical protein